MKYEIRLETIKKRLPNKFQLPASFDAFAETCAAHSRGDLGWFAIKYTKPKDLLEFDPASDVVPFLRLPDGGFAAFWFVTSRSPAVIHCNSDGECQVIAATWNDFLNRLQKRRTGMPDVDEQEVPTFPKIKGARSNKLVPLAPLKKKFRQWLKTHRPEEEVAGGVDEGEALRRELLKLMEPDFKEFVRDWEKSYGESDGITPHVSFVAHLTSRSFTVKQPSGLPYPNPNRLRPVLERLVAYLGRSLKQCDITLWKDGAVFVDKNICLGDRKHYRD